jgi:hypothetical protein
MTNNKVSYSSRVYIDFSSIFKDADKDTSNIIWKHLLTISALVDPAGKAKDILKNNKDSKEASFLSDIINKVESNVNPNSNPLEAITSIMSSGVFTDLVAGMNTGIQNGELDLGKLMGTVQTMCSTLSSDIDKNSQSAGDNPINMLTSLMSNMSNIDNLGKKEGSGGDIPDLSNLTSLLGPMLTSLNNNSSPVDIENKINKINKQVKMTMPTITEVSSEDSISTKHNDLD